MSALTFYQTEGWQPGTPQDTVKMTNPIPIGRNAAFPLYISFLPRRFGANAEASRPTSIYCNISQPNVNGTLYNYSLEYFAFKKQASIRVHYVAELHPSIFFQKKGDSECILARNTFFSIPPWVSFAKKDEKRPAITFYYQDSFNKT